MAHFEKDEIVYAGFPSVLLMDRPGGKPVEHVIWGDWLRVLGEEPRDGWIRIHARGEDGWVREAQLVRERLLEIVFVDIGQGDGAIVSTPEDDHLVVDAGQEDNMYRFLRWRFGRFQRPFTFKGAVISHPDQDHYKGFRALLDDPNVRFGTIFHNGIVERSGKDRLGPVEDGFLTDVIETREQLEQLLTPENRGGMTYPNMLHDALESGRVGDVRSVSAADATLPGFDGEGGAGVRIEVLGPVAHRETERTFFRHFADKREVLFDGEAVLRAALIPAIAAAGEDQGPVDALFGAFRTVLPILEANRSFSEPRQRVISATPALREREIAKHAALADTLALALQERGVDPLQAALAAHAAMAAFVHATTSWLEHPGCGLAERLDEAERALSALFLQS